MFSFVPLVKKLPRKSTMSEEERCGAPIGHANKTEAASGEGTNGEAMSARAALRVEKVFIKDSAGGAAGDAVEASGGNQLHLVSRLQAEAPPPAGSRPGSPAWKAASTDAAGCKPGGAGAAKVSAGRLGWDDGSSPADSADLWPPLASSRESILSESWDAKDGGWSAAGGSAAGASSLSRTVSPCSSVLSGVFSPAVVRVKRHFLEPGSSLVHTPCFSSRESLSPSSACPQSPPPPQPPRRRRPPLTRLSLLTAILRKGRLPVLSSALQRPYTPCWPMSPVTLSFCSACSAASSVASIPLELSSRCPSSVSVDSQSPTHGCVGASAAEARVDRCSERVRSGGAVFRHRPLSPPPPPTSTSRYTHASSPPKRDFGASTNLPRAPHAPKPSDTCGWPRGRAGNDDEMLGHGTTACPRGSRPASATLSRLHKLSLRLRTPPRSPPPPPFPPPPPPAREVTQSPLPPTQIIAGRYRPERGQRGAEFPAVSQGLHRGRQLSPTRCTPVPSPGWLSPSSASPTPTPSPLPPCRHPSPCPSPLSMRSTPSPRPGSGISDYSDGEGKKRKVAARLPAACALVWIKLGMQLRRDMRLPALIRLSVQSMLKLLRVSGLWHVVNSDGISVRSR